MVDTTGIDSAEELETQTQAAKVLEVSVDADDETIQNAFQDATLETHPDAGGDADDFIIVQKARDVLTGDTDTQYDKGDAEDDGGRGSGAGGQAGGGSTSSGGSATDQSWRRATGFNKEASEKVLNAVEGMLKQHTTEEDLKAKYGPHATIENVAEILAAMIVNGGIDLGDVSKMLNEGIRFGPNADAATGGVFSGDRSGGGLFGGGGGGGMYSSNPSDYMNFDPDPDDEDDEE